MENTTTPKKNDGLAEVITNEETKRLVEKIANEGAKVPKVIDMGIPTPEKSGYPVSIGERCNDGQPHNFLLLDVQFDSAKGGGRWERIDVFFCTQCLIQKRTSAIHEGKTKPVWFTRD